MTGRSIPVPRPARSPRPFSSAITWRRRAERIGTRLNAFCVVRFAALGSTAAGCERGPAFVVERREDLAGDSVEVADVGVVEHLGNAADDLFAGGLDVSADPLARSA